jgi:hypothetical protein
MCDYSLHNVKSRPAKVGDKLTTRRFPLGTGGFSAPEDINVAVCLRPGTELSFTDEVRRRRIWPGSKNVTYHKTAIFRQIDQHNPVAHHDALEFPDGRIVLLTLLEEGQHSMPSRPRSATVAPAIGLSPTLADGAVQTPHRL